MHHFLVAALLGIFFICSRASTGFIYSAASTAPKSTPEQADISRSGRDFLEVCSSIDSKQGIDSEGNRDPARIQRDATCLGWVEGFADGFLVHEELLSVPRRDLADNPEKAHRATRYIASIALAGAFPCRAGK